MASFGGVNGAPMLWQEARNPEGRVYYYHTVTKATQWTKPVELMTPAERALADQPWQEYKTPEGRKYWSHKETKESTWEMPEPFKSALAADSFQAASSIGAPEFVAGGRAHIDQIHRSENAPLNESRQIAYGNDSSSRAQAFVPSNTDPEYASLEDAQVAFTKLLRRQITNPDMPWVEAMKIIIKDPQYRSIKDPRDRKLTYEKFVTDFRAQEKERAKERIEKLRNDFATMLRSHPEIKHYSRWKTVRPIIQGETIFRSARDDGERRALFDEYISDLKQAQIDNESKMRTSAMDELVSILTALNLEPYTRWAEAREIIESNPRFQTEKFKSLSKSDVLTAFENHIKSAEKTFNDARQLQKNQRLRRERQIRDRFIDLLKELRADGKIKAGTKWSQVYPLLASDERYTAILGQTGSTPLDLFRDILEEEERALRSTRNDVLDVLDDKRFEIQTQTMFGEFLEVMHKDRRTTNVDEDALRLIFERLHDKVVRRSEDDKYHIERQQRRLTDALRSYIKHLEPPVHVDDTYEKVLPRIANSDEYKAVSSDEARRSAFEKVIRRLREKDEDARERAKRRDRGSPRRDRDRADRQRNGARNGRSRSPERERNAYEDERRKAISEREKNYRKTSTSAAETLLSESTRDRDRYERSHYERERRERESEREQLYRRRESKAVDELPYGDDRGSGRRRRANSDASEDRRESKRSRREITPSKRERSPSLRDRRHRSRTPHAAPATAPAKEDPGVHSGSEEGEIEED